VVFVLCFVVVWVCVFDAVGVRTSPWYGCYFIDSLLENYKVISGLKDFDSLKELVESSSNYNSMLCSMYKHGMDLFLPDDMIGTTFMGNDITAVNFIYTEKDAKTKKEKDIQFTPEKVFQCISNYCQFFIEFLPKSMSASIKPIGVSVSKTIGAVALFQAAAEGHIGSGSDIQHELRSVIITAIQEDPRLLEELRLVVNDAGLIIRSLRSVMQKILFQTAIPLEDEWFYVFEKNETQTHRTTRLPVVLLSGIVFFASQIGDYE
jgi:hypothetical protein